MELSVQNVYGLLLRSRLLSPDEARKMFERWQAEAGDRAADAAEFARWMVAHRYVTDYQATVLARGHADCFFLDQYKVLDRIGRGGAGPCRRRPCGRGPGGPGSCTRRRKNRPRGRGTAG